MSEGSNLFNPEAQARRKLTMVVAVAASLVILLKLLGIFSSLDLKIYDAWFSVFGENRNPSASVAIVGLDDKTVANHGSPPWQRSIYPPLIEKLSEAGASVIGFDVTFGPDPRQLEHNPDFAEAMRKAGNVVFGYIFTDLGDPSPPGTPPDEAVARTAVPGFDDTGFALPHAPSYEKPEPQLAGAALALGHVTFIADEDGILRQVPLLIKHGDDVYPSLALQMARIHTKTELEDLRVEGDTIQLDYASIPVTDSGRALLNWPSSPPRFPNYSFVDVVRGDIQADAFHGKAVLVGATLAGEDEKAYPFAGAAPGVWAHATFLDNFFKVSFKSAPTWAWLLELALVLAFCAASVVLLPRLPTKFAIAGIAALLLLVVGTSGFLFSTKGVWLKVLYPSLALLVPFGAMMTVKLRMKEEEVRDVSAEKLEKEKQLGLSFQEKGLLDMALATFDKLPMSDDMKLIYYNLAIDFEHRGLREKGFLALKRLVETDPDYEDAAVRLESLRQGGVGTRAFVQPTMVPSGTAMPTPQPTAMPTSAPASMPTSAATAMGPDATAAGPEDATQGVSDAPTSMPTGAPTGAPTSMPTGAPTSVPTAHPTSAPTSMPTAGGAPPGMAAPPPGPPVMVPGASIGRYLIEKKLGKGAMGEVYLVKDAKVGRLAALKTMRPDVDLTPQQGIEMRQRFYREAQTAGKLSHPNIVTVYDADEVGGVSYIIMEFVEGDTLTNWMKKGPLTIPQIKHIVVNAALGLDFAHQNGVFHRDVKPDNIMVAKKTGAVKVMDFGIARLVESDMTRTGSVLGTPAYMSPEQISGKKVDARSDVFSLGVVLYELLTRKRPFSGESPTAVMFSILQKDPPQASSVSDAVNPGWDDILGKAMAKKAEDRYQTSRDFATAVKDGPAK